MQKEYKRNVDNGFVAANSPAHFVAHAGRGAGGARAGGGSKRRGVAAGVPAWLARLAGVFAAGRAGDCGGVGLIR